MRLGLINSAWVQTGRPTVYGLEQTKALGFDCVDLFLDPLDLDVREKRLIAETCARLELPIVSLCVVALGLADFNPTVRDFHRRRVRAFLDLAHEFRAQNILLVLGEYVWNREVIPPDEQWRTAVGELVFLGEYAAGLGLEIAIELEPFPLSLVNDIDSMVRLLDDVGLDNVQANVDISHLALSRVAPAELRRLRGRAAHVHISDCNGQVHGDLPPGRGVVDFGPYLREIRELGISGALSIELEYSPEPERIVDWVAEAYGATRRLMAEHGLAE